ncbi:MAG: AAA family ATPase [Fibrobacter sp.]|uniref:replicative DNA helicase n=1 Tax=Fibrobacter sp. TaxID=35828 RepID=UPI0025BD0F76|nr:DnaB-like helicase C-terminal domain-containing protein [Fibrobacter sp.]MBQ9226540.1 AAA family ATPase [Fibrobacter sp.]
MSDEKQKKVLTLPSNPYLEIETIGAALVWSESGPKVLCGILDPEDFTDARCRVILQTMKEMIKANIEVDAQSLTNRLVERNLYKASGGNEFMFDAINSVILDPSEVIERNSNILRQASTARKMVLYCKQVSTNFDEMIASSDANGWQEFAERVRQSVNNIADSSQTVQLVSSQEAVEMALEEVRLAKESSKNGLIGVEMGLDGLDKLVHGYQPGQFVIIGGKPSMGKSAFAAHSAYSAALSGAEVAFFSLEMTVQSNVKRILSNESKVVTEKMNSGFTSKSEFELLEEAAKRVSGANLWFTDQISGYEEIVAAITKLKAKRDGLKVVFIDYLQLMSNSFKGVSRDREIGMMTGGLKRLATKLKISIVALSQVKRGSGNDRPTLDDLRESGNIEQDANVVIFVHRPDYFDGKAQTRVSAADIIVAKNREGQTGMVKASYDKGLSRFTDMAPERENNKK